MNHYCLSISYHCLSCVFYAQNQNVSNTAQSLSSRIISNQQRLEENLLYIQAIMVACKSPITYDDLENWLQKQRQHNIEAYESSKGILHYYTLHKISLRVNLFSAASRVR